MVRAAPQALHTGGTSGCVGVCRHIRRCTAPQWCNDNRAICRCSDECGGDCGECSLTAHYLCEQWRRDQAALWTRVRNHTAACMHACMHACALHTICACQHQANMRAHSPLARRFRAPAWLPALLGAHWPAALRRAHGPPPDSIDSIRSTSALAGRGGGLLAPKGSAQAAEPRLSVRSAGQRRRIRARRIGATAPRATRNGRYAQSPQLYRVSRPRHSVG